MGLSRLKRIRQLLSNVEVICFVMLRDVHKHRRGGVDTTATACCSAVPCKGAGACALHGMILVKECIQDLRQECNVQIQKELTDKIWE